MQAIVLAGGFGTRLKTVIPDTPKPMAPITNTPFLCWLFSYMATQSVTEIVICTHHLHQQISERFGNHYAGIKIHYSIEEQPLGTGGAMQKALEVLKPTQPVIALNGDSFVEVDYAKLLATHNSHNSSFTVALFQVPDCSRYGTVQTHGPHITAYEYAQKSGPGLISTGVYALDPNMFDDLDLPEAFSFEKDVMEPITPTLKPGHLTIDGYFIDIGIPQDYARAQVEIPTMIELANDQ